MHAALADAVLVLHLAFVFFVALGGLLVLRWPQVAWGHVPAAVWGIAIEFGGWICPLTPLENHLRLRAGQSTYQGDFIGRYVVPVLYPESLTRDTQFLLGGAALVLNVAVYALVIRRHRRAADRAARRRERLR